MWERPPGSFVAGPCDRHGHGRLSIGKCLFGMVGKETRLTWGLICATACRFCDAHGFKRLLSPLSRPQRCSSRGGCALWTSVRGGGWFGPAPSPPRPHRPSIDGGKADAGSVWHFAEC